MKESFAFTLVPLHFTVFWVMLLLVDSCKLSYHVYALNSVNLEKENNQTFLINVLSTLRNLLIISIVNKTKKLQYCFFL